MQPLTETLAGTLANLVLLAVLPFLGYYLFHALKRKRTLAEVARRAGLQLGDSRYLLYAAAVSLVVVVALALWLTDPEPLTREGSAMRRFAGLGLGGQTVLMALLYGVIKTGFCEELLFRGLIAGSLGRRMRLPWANLLQTLIFLLPHVVILFIAPELWPLLVLIFVFSLFKGWLRIRSGSILGPWLLHATGNTAVVLLTAARSGGVT